MMLEAIRRSRSGNAGDLRQHQQGLWRTGRPRDGGSGGPLHCRLDTACAARRRTRRGRSISARHMAAPRATADQYVLDYAHSYRLRTAVLRMSCIYGPRQFGTEDQGWVAHFLIRAAAWRADHGLWRRQAGARCAARERRRGGLPRRAGKHRACCAGGRSIWAAARRMRSACGWCWRKSHGAGEQSSLSCGAGVPATSYILSPTPPVARSGRLAGRASAGARVCGIWRTGGCAADPGACRPSG